MNVEKVVTVGQLVLSILYIAVYTLVMVLFMMGYAKIPVEYKEAFIALITLLSTGNLTILYFWFQRSRSQSNDPAIPPVDPGV
jgi:hypothetical protein